MSAQLTAGNDVGVISQSFANGSVSAGTSGGAGLAGLGTSNANVMISVIDKPVSMNPYPGIW